MNTRITKALVALALGFSASLTAAQSDFPSHPVRLFVGFPPGGATDVLARALAQEARGSLGQEIVVVNRPGASGAIAVNEVAAAKPDGHTLGISPTAAFTMAFHFMDIRPDLLEAIDPLMTAARQRTGMVVRGDSPHRTLKELMEFARKNPGKVSIGIPGIGTAVEIFSREVLRHAKADATIVPFKGDADLATALLGGQIVAGSLSAGGFVQQVQAGRMRLVASFQNDRFSVAPDVPTLEEMGYGLTSTAIQILYGPKGLPPAVAKRLIADLSKAVRSRTYIDIARKNELYEKDMLFGDALNAYLLKDRATNRVLVEKLGLKKQ